MAQLQIKMTYCLPEQLREVTEDGRRFVERSPSHPTRPARASDWNTWWEDAANVRFVPGENATYRLA